MADSVRDQMALVTKKLHSELEAMHQKVMATLQDWQGAAKDQYMQAKKEWDAAAQRMPEKLHRTEVALQQITNGYLQVEHTGINAWGGYGVK
ncbi:WXG100 family type VII secretion target [Lentzea flava]|nr:WXG100 family type VII secretion target [Lentzea flava]